jgi:hypothetical protein
MRLFTGLASKFKAKPFLFIGGAIVLLWIFGKQFNKLLSFFRGRLQGSVVTTSVNKKVAQDSGTTVETVKASVREETCKGVASAIFAALHEKPWGFLPRSFFGSTEDESEVVSECNSLKNGLEAKFMSSYYFEKYQNRLKGLIIKYVDNYKDIRRNFK